MQQQTTAETTSARPRRFVACALVAVALPAMFLGSSSATPTFASPMLTGIRGYEPGLDIASDGTMFVNAPGGFPGGHGMISRFRPGVDTKFQQLSFGNPWRFFPGSGDSDVALAPPGNTGGNRVYFLDMWVGSNALIVSEDNGTTWSYGNPVTNVPTTDRQWIGVGSRDPLTDRDTLYVVYQQFGPPSWAMFARSTDGGLTWPYQRPIPGLVGTSTGPFHNLVSKGDFVAVVYSVGDNLKISRSTDAGMTWATSDITLLQGVADQIPSVALDEVTGYLYVTWIRPQDGGVYVDRSTDGGVTWHRQRYQYPAKISAPGTSNAFAAVAARDGKVGVAWYSTPLIGTSSFQPDDQAQGEWRVTYAEATDTGGALSFTAPVSAASSIVLRGVLCTQGLACDLPGGPGGTSRDLGDFLQIQIDGDRKAAIVYGQGSQARVARQTS